MWNDKKPKAAIGSGIVENFQFKTLVRMSSPAVCLFHHYQKYQSELPVTLIHFNWSPYGQVGLGEWIEQPPLIFEVYFSHGKMPEINQAPMVHLEDSYVLV